jgi:hypothetical protein
MDVSIAPRSASPCERSTDLETPRLSRRASLLLMLVLSLGLWGAIWAAVSYLASVVASERGMPASAISCSAIRPLARPSP